MNSSAMMATLTAKMSGGHNAAVVAVRQLASEYAECGICSVPFTRTRPLGFHPNVLSGGSGCL